MRCVCITVEEVPRKIQCDKCHIWQHEDYVKNLCDQCIPTRTILQEHAATQIDDNDPFLLPHSNTALDGAKLEIDSLRELLKEKENDLQDEKDEVIQLQKEKGWLHLAQNDRDSQEGIPLGETLRKLLQKIHELNIELDTRKVLGTFTKLSSTSRQPFYRKFDSELRQAYALSQQMLVHSGNDNSLLQPPLQRYPELKAIVLRSLGVEDAGETALDRATEQLSKLSVQAAVRAIITCALQSWVYETDFPSDQFGSSYMVENYRACVLKQDGALALRNLDLAALHSFVKADSFQQNIVVNKAAGLAIRLSQVLAPLFSDSPNAPSEKGFDGFATWRENTEDWKARQDRMTEMFRCALMAKAGSCLNLEKYEMLIHAPGTRFGKSSMSIETMEGMPDPRNHQGRSVQICVEPAVYSYKREEVLETSPISETSLLTQNFMLGGESQRGKGNALIKAVVILSEGD